MNIAHLPNNLRILNEANCLNAFYYQEFRLDFYKLNHPGRQHRHTVKYYENIHVS